MKYLMKRLVATMVVAFVVIAGLNTSLVGRLETTSSSRIEVEGDNKCVLLPYENVGEETEYGRSGYDGVLKKSTRPDYEEGGTLRYGYPGNPKK